MNKPDYFASAIEQRQREVEAADPELLAVAQVFVDRLVAGQLPDALVDKQPLWYAWAVRAAFEEGAKWAWNLREKTF